MHKWFGISAIVVALDLYTKHLIENAFQLGDSKVVTFFFNLVRFHNEGAAFSFLSNAGGWQRWFFTTVAVIAVVVISYLIRKHAQQKLFCLGLALLLGGALGNLYDRLTLGYVVDFLYFHINDLYWPAFNVADSAVCVGVALLLWDSFKQDALTAKKDA
ncbi:MAG TPA: signal peptidase II [Methylophilus sp.]|nr:signal peptidase II [Methylophilus sp.]HQQ33605.1 signal peptidase II [Methylophilus sp.]